MKACAPWNGIWGKESSKDDDTKRSQDKSCRVDLNLHNGGGQNALGEISSRR